MKLQTELETLETRATELDAQAAAAAKESAALDAQLAGGDFKQAGAAAGKRAELDAINRALDNVNQDAQRVQSELDAQNAAAAHAAKVAHLREVASEIMTLDAQAHAAAAELASELDKRLSAIEATRNKAHALRYEFKRAHQSEPALIAEAISPQTQSAIGFRASGYQTGFQDPTIFAGRNADIGNAVESAIASAIVSRAHKAAKVQNVPGVPLRRGEDPAWFTAATNAIEPK